MIRNILASLALFALLLGGCGGPDKYVLTGTERTAGTDGELTVEDLEGNRMIEIDLEHLPPPSRVSEGATVYVVWVKPGNGTPAMAGRLDYDEDDRTGHMRATTPETRFELLITAERNGSVASPSDIVVARQRVGGSDD